MKYQIRNDWLGGLNLAAGVVCVLAIPANLAIGNYGFALANIGLGLFNLWLAFEKKSNEDRN